MTGHHKIILKERSMCLMKGRVEKGKQSLDGVRCVVDSCYYWGNGDNCMASQIEIEPRNAGNSEDTDCSTFAPK